MIVAKPEGGPRFSSDYVLVSAMGNADVTLKPGRSSWIGQRRKLGPWSAVSQLPALSSGPPLLANRTTSRTEKTRNMEDEAKKQINEQDFHSHCGSGTSIRGTHHHRQANSVIAIKATRAINSRSAMTRRGAQVKVTTVLFSEERSMFSAIQYQSRPMARINTARSQTSVR